MAEEGKPKRTTQKAKAEAEKAETAAENLAETVESAVEQAQRVKDEVRADFQSLKEKIKKIEEEIKEDEDNGVDDPPQPGHSTVKNPGTTNPITYHVGTNIPRPPAPNLEDTPLTEQSLNEFKSQRRLDINSAVAQYEESVGKAEDTYIQATGTWNTAKKTRDNNILIAQATANATAQTAVLDYYKSINKNTDSCKDKFPSAEQMLIFWYTMDNTVQTANADYMKTTGGIEATYKTAYGVYEAAAETYSYTLRQAFYTLLAAVDKAQETYWTSIQKALSS